MEKLNHAIFKSIRTRVILLIIFIAIISISAVGLVTLYRSEQIVKKEATEKLMLQSSLQSAVFEQELQRLRNSEKAIETIIRSNMAGTTMDDAEFQTFKDKSAAQILQLGLLDNPLSLWIVFDPQWRKSGHTITFIDKNNDGIYDREAEYDISLMDLSSPNLQWWTQAIEKGEVWTSPYYWEKWNRELISYSKAIFIDSLFIGCAGSDFDFSNLQQRLKEIKIYQTGYIALLDQSYQLIIHPMATGIDAKKILSDNDFNEITQKTTAHHSGTLSFSSFNKQKMMAFERLSNGWILMAVAPVDEILLPLKQIRQTIWIIMILAGVLAGLMAFVFSTRLIQPIFQLINLFEKSKSGQLYHRWNNNSLLEYNKLGNHYNRFMEQMQQMITQLQQQHQELAIALHKAKESDDLKTAFLGNLSHEIRTPLNAITGFSSLLDNLELANEERHDYVEIIMKNGDRLLKFVDNIVIFSKLERHLLTPKLNNMVMDKVIQDIFQKSTKEYQSTEKQIDWQLSNALPPSEINIDVEFFTLIADSLVDNAWKFTKSGFIKMGSFTTPHHWVFFVDDSGLGIPEAFHEAVFFKFFKYADMHTDVIYPGVGMGLSIAKGLALLMGGDIQLQSMLGKGSRFELQMPLKSKESGNKEES